MEELTEEIASTLLLLPAELESELARRAAAGHPREVCGLLIGTVEGRRIRVERLAEARNLESERPESRYTLDPDAFLAADNAARAEAREVVGIWHSHPDSPARPSAVDRQHAWAAYSYLIVSVTCRGEIGFRSWRLVRGCFLEETILQPDVD